MAKRGRKRKAMKLKKETVYILFSLMLLVSALFVTLSFFKSGDVFVKANDVLSSELGQMMYLLPLLLFFFGMFCLRIKFFLSRAHLSIGYAIAFFSLTALLKAGSFGFHSYDVLHGILGTAGTNLVYIAGLFVGVIVLFDTSLDELGQGFVHILNNIYRFLPGGNRFGKDIKVRGGNAKEVKKEEKEDKKAPVFAREQPLKEPVVNKKEQAALMSEKLVTNMLETGGIWEYPQLGLLSDVPGKKAERGDIKKTASIIEKTLQSFGIAARVAEVNLGPAVTQYALEIALGTKVSKITSLANDLALATEAPTGQIRIEAPIPGRSLVGIEIPNRSLEIVTLRTMLGSAVMQKQKSKLTVALGLDVSGNPVVADIAKMPHVLIAGTTGSGKSIAMNSFITSILFRASPNEVKFIMIDPKRVEMTGYNGIPHLLTQVIVEPEKILSALKWAMGEMDRRYKIFAERGVRNIDSYNELSGFQALPAIVILIDELADLMIFAPVEVEDTIARLAQMARATGIHLVIATQRPSVDVITGLIKANIPCRIAFNVSSLVDSRVILDGPGAEKLLGRGDMLYVPPDAAKPTRVQGTFVSEREVQQLVSYLKEKSPVVNYTEEVTEQSVTIKKGLGAMQQNGNEDHDQLFEEAIKIVCQFDKASASLLQRKLSIGYSRAAKILDQLEEAGVIGPAEGSKPRDVIARSADEVLARLHE